MTFNKDVWQEQIEYKWGEFKGWLQRRRQQDLPYVVYGALAGVTLWPLVESAVNTGQVAPVAFALYGTAASVGANLIANQIEAWKSRAAPPDEDKVAAWAAQEAAANADVRQTLDTLLEKLDVPPRAAAMLPESDRAWFHQTLQDELTRLGSQPRFVAYVHGGGTIVQGEGNQVATGGSVVIGGNVSGGVTLGRTRAEDVADD